MELADLLGMVTGWGPGVPPEAGPEPEPEEPEEKGGTKED